MLGRVGIRGEPRRRRRQGVRYCGDPAAAFGEAQRARRRRAPFRWLLPTMAWRSSSRSMSRAVPRAMSGSRATSRSEQSWSKVKAALSYRPLRSAAVLVGLGLVHESAEVRDQVRGRERRLEVITRPSPARGVATVVRRSPGSRTPRRGRSGSGPQRHPGWRRSLRGYSRARLDPSAYDRERVPIGPR